MELNDKEGPNAIHGFVRKRPWRTVRRTDSEVAFAVDIREEELAAKGYPFSLHVQVTYRLDARGMACEFEIQNIGNDTAPVAAGFHPYFTVGAETIDDARLTLPMAAVLEYDSGLLPTGNVLPIEKTNLDFRQERAIGATIFNSCFCAPSRDADGLVRIQLADSSGRRPLTVWMDESFDYVVLYSGDPLPETHRRRALAIEPMTCGSDAFNHPEWSLVPLPPQGVFRGAWGVEV